MKELADKYGVSVMTMTGFLDGINDSLTEKNPIEEMEEDTAVNLGFAKALLYRTWLRRRQTGFITWRNGTVSLMRRQKRLCIRNRNLQLQS